MEMKIRFGVLSSAKIAIKQVIPAIQQSKYCIVAGLASRNLETARSICKTLDIEKAYGSYEELLADKEIDAVYIPLPNHLHVPWAIKALEAGKHVLCEKPLGLSSDEVRTLIAAARHHKDCKVMEAFMYRHHPQWKKAKELVENGDIGELRAIQSFFSYYNDDPENIRNIAQIGGGGMMDIGCYCLSLSRFLFGCMPKRVCGMGTTDRAFGTDVLFSGLLDFDGKSSIFTCSTQLAPYQRAVIMGTKGSIEILIPFNAPVDRPCVLIHEGKGSRKTYEFDLCDQYTLQADSFARSVVDDTAVYTPLSDGLENMVLLERCLQSGQENRWIEVEDVI